MFEFLDDASCGFDFWAIDLTDDDGLLRDTAACCFTLGIESHPYCPPYYSALDVVHIVKDDVIFVFVDDKLQYVFEVLEMMTRSETQGCLCMDEPDGTVAEYWMTTVRARRMPFRTERLYQDDCLDEDDQLMSDAIHRALRQSRKGHTDLSGVAWPFDFHVGCEVFEFLDRNLDKSPLDCELDAPPF